MPTLLFTAIMAPRKSHKQEACVWATGIIAGRGDGELVCKPERLPLSMGSAGNKIVSLSCGREHVLLLSRDGHAFAMGRNSFGQLGCGHRQRLDAPLVVESRYLANARVVQVACGGFHSCLLLDDGRVISAGSGRYGQLGSGLERDHETFHAVRFEREVDQRPFVYISCGDSHSVGIAGERLEVKGSQQAQEQQNRRRRQTVWVWGNGSQGRLGCDNEEDRKFPTWVKSFATPDADLPMTPFKSIIDVSCGFDCTAVVDEEGQVFAWGNCKPSREGNPHKMAITSDTGLGKIGSGRYVLLTLGV